MYAKFSEKLAILTSYVRVRIRGGGGGGKKGNFLGKFCVYTKLLKPYIVSPKVLITSSQKYHKISMLYQAMDQ